jgi:hypothetical protein
MSPRLIAPLALLVALACPDPPSSALDEVYEGFADPYPSLLVTNPRTVATLERNGFSFGTVLGASGESAVPLTSSALYGDLVHALEGEISELAKTTSHAGVGFGHVHRLFDTRWLTSERAHFELVGVVNRIDFRSLLPPGCGQTRLVYRLAYEAVNRPLTRLPMTVNVIYENRTGRCDDLARTWRALDDGVNVADRLRRGPLASLAPGHFDGLEINVQSLRENSANAKTDDHAEYILRSFAVSGGHLVPDRLRNTPEPALDTAKKEALRSWIGDHLDAIDDGSAELPRDLLADEAVSVTPRGLSRPANRPYAALFPEPDATFGELPFAGKKIAMSPVMLVRRLDEMTCMGCHQSRSVAGFHLLGEDRTIATFDTMALGISEHLRQILEWRHRFLLAAAEMRVLSEPVPLPEHVDDEGTYSSHCTVQDEGGSSSLPSWKCAAGTTCTRSPVDDDPVGVCQPTGAKHVGDTCQNVRLVATPGADGDTVHPHHAEECSGTEVEASNERRKCDTNRRGFPGGMCTATCSIAGERTGDAVCERIPHFGFEQACFAPGAILEKCLLEEGNSVLERLRVCSRSAACRDDFVCARFPGLQLDEGACVPPYFLFQTRVDGPSADR